MKKIEYNYKINNIQAGIFYDYWTTSNILKIASRIEDFFGEKFSGDKLVLPNNEEGPSEIPRIIMESENEKSQLRIGAIKGEIFFNQNIDIQEINKLIINLAKISLEEFNWTMNGLGINVEYIFSLKNISPITFIENEYFKKTIHNNSKQLEYNTMIKSDW